ncbi:hypothetical protein [Neorhodopirellula pilleata]|uniref:Uncharacterized protein n=1 Tax=Neorhodopirellula pilleata TaxID=2714738 RepID=A0A5C5ZUX1_9BACT|nr:hypothetical protein [Neorhodopirellula pilleata]TWT91169.1 hypothetical protein Pla100_53430 [Neorhodopirellula pilleata]
MNSKPRIAIYLMTSFLAAAFVLQTGCDRKETVIDIEGPDGGGVSVERDVDDGGITVDVDR